MYYIDVITYYHYAYIASSKLGLCNSDNVLMFIAMNFSMVGVTIFHVTIDFVQEDATTKCVVEIVEMLRRGETPPVSLINILYSFKSIEIEIASF